MNSVIAFDRATQSRLEEEHMSSIEPRVAGWSPRPAGGLHDWRRLRHGPNGRARSAYGPAKRCDDTELVTNLVTEPQRRQSPLEAGFAKCLKALGIWWLRGQDLNLRPLGYEPHEAQRLRVGQTGKNRCQSTS